MVERLSPGLSAFYATVVLIVIVLTQDALTAFFRRDFNFVAHLRKSFDHFIHGLHDGGINMVGVAIATATAGIIVGTVSLTGIGLVMTEIVELISGGNLLIMLLLTAVICLILGMGLPTTANYIVVATLMAPVIVELAAKSDLAVPLVAAHLFVFYFGLMADVTPPVGLASFAAAAISGASPIATGIQAFRYEIRTALLPFIFIFNNQLLLIGVDNVFYAFVIIAGSIVAMLLFVAATQGWFLVRSRFWETAALFLACFILFRPGFLMDYDLSRRSSPRRRASSTISPPKRRPAAMSASTLSARICVAGRSTRPSRCASMGMGRLRSVSPQPAWRSATTMARSSLTTSVSAPRRRKSASISTIRSPRSRSRSSARQRSFSISSAWRSPASSPGTSAAGGRRPRTPEAGGAA